MRMTSRCALNVWSRLFLKFWCFCETAETSVSLFGLYLCWLYLFVCLPVCLSTPPARLSVLQGAREESLCCSRDSNLILRLRCAELPRSFTGFWISVRLRKCCCEFTSIDRWLLGNQANGLCELKRPSLERCQLSAPNRPRPENRTGPEQSRSRSRRRPESWSRRPCSSSWIPPKH